MIAAGTVSAPIVFRANIATAAAGDWYNVLAQAGSHLRLVLLRHRLRRP